MAVNFETKVVRNAVRDGSISEQSGQGAEIIARAAVEVQKQREAKPIPFAVGDNENPDGLDVFVALNSANASVAGLSSGEIEFVRQVYNEMLETAANAFAGLAAIAEEQSDWDPSEYSVRAALSASGGQQMGVPVGTEVVFDWYPDEDNPKIASDMYVAETGERIGSILSESDFTQIRPNAE